MTPPTDTTADHHLPVGGGDSNMPPIVKLILQIGVPSAIALYLVWLLGNSIPRLESEVRHMNENLKTHANDSAAYSQAIDRLERRMEIGNDIARQQCVQGARSASAQQACLSAGRDR
jgi:hypothetical protein